MNEHQSQSQLPLPPLHLQQPRILHNNNNQQQQQSVQTQLSRADLDKMSDKVQQLQGQLVAENEANDDLTEQLDQAYKAGYRTRQENAKLTQESELLQAQVR